MTHKFLIRFTGITTSLLVALSVSVQTVDGQDWSNSKYRDVIDKIRGNHDDLPTTANMPGFILRTPDVVDNMVEMSYIFGYDDAEFGINGYMPLLNKYEVVGKERSWIPYNLHTINQDMVGRSGFVKPGNASADLGLNDANTPWLTKSGELKEYMDNRSDQWELGLDPTSDSVKNPWRRAAATVGMFYDPLSQNNGGGYANNYVVTFTVDKNAIFRPNGNQSVFGAGMNSAIGAEFIQQTGSAYWEPNPAFNDPWLNTLDDYLFESNSGLRYNTYASFYQQWWQQNLIVDSAVPIHNITGFPWTGIGYTYDWYYQDKLEWSELGPGSQPKGAGLSEFVLMPSRPGGLWEIGEIVNIQTTAQYLGDTQAWGAPMQNFSVPEPTSLSVFGFTAVLLFGWNIIRTLKRTSAAAT